MTDSYAVRTEAQLREIIPEPEPELARKLFDHVDPYAREFIAKSPLLFVATYGPESGIDVSPKGDAPGFVHVESPRTLWIPERRGNRLAYGFRNLLRNPSIGLLFVVPGVTETLRVNGKAEIRKDPELLEKLSGGGKPAILVTKVLVEECFFHCGKAFLRSTLWSSSTWPAGVRADIGKQIARRSNQDDAAAEKIEADLLESYQKRLY